MIEKIRNIIDENKYFEYFIQTLIVLSIVLFTLETSKGKPEYFYRILDVFEGFFMLVFTLEYITRVFVAKVRKNYIFSFYWIIDFLAILPFYMTFWWMSFVSLKVFRVFRLFRIFKLLKYNRAFNRLKIAAKIAKEEVLIFISIVLILVYFSSVWIYYFENEAQPELFSSIFDSLYWSVITLTTVWYGDITPITTGGRFFTMIMLILWVWVVTIPAWLVSSAMSQAKNLEWLEAEASLKINSDKIKKEVEKNVS